MAKRNLLQKQTSIPSPVLLGAAGLSLWLGRQAWRKMRAASFKDQVVLITGGSRGLGYRLAKLFYEEGARVALCARDAAELERAARSLDSGPSARPHLHQILTYACDLRSEQDVIRTIDRVALHLGRIDVLINDAGIMEVGPLETWTLEDFRLAYEANCLSQIHASLAALPHLRHSRQARIVNITSIGGVLAFPHLLPYTVSKFAARGFSEGLTVELRKQGIKVTTVIPGLMRTGSFLHAQFKGRQEEEFRWFALASSSPLFSMSASAAASKIIEACRAGDAVLTLGWPAKVGRWVSALFPNTTLQMLTWVQKALPSAVGGSRRLDEGAHHRTPLSSGAFTALGDAAAVENLEIPRPRFETR